MTLAIFLLCSSQDTQSAHKLFVAEGICQIQKRFLGFCSSYTIESQEAEERHIAVFRQHPSAGYTEHDLVIILCIRVILPDDHTQNLMSFCSPTSECYILLII